MTAREWLDLYQVRCVRIGAGVIAQCAKDCAAAGARRVLIVSSAPIARFAETLAAALSEQGVSAYIWQGPDGEPTRTHVAEPGRAPGSMV